MRYAEAMPPAQLGQKPLLNSIAGVMELGYSRVEQPVAMMTAFARTRTKAPTYTNGGG